MMLERFMSQMVTDFQHAVAAESSWAFCLKYGAIIFGLVGSVGFMLWLVVEAIL